ncbi:MAG: molybdopterin-dependent oxidoreductase [Saprospiraceae bacterium]|uniref:Molybdopterin-dependent oxidoreductase n=1 Tax=Candidatus Opimibacter skivensis TaxID=2982028 RepID=A0A9D7SVF3_9BACT|nr:molybdopterin-dependent oxidoreductase [Candidatus Opimibacter skivensis]
MNQARALVHAHTDGSMAVSTGAVEMGRGKYKNATGCS